LNSSILIDFKHRPFVFGNDVELSKEELVIIDAEPDETIATNEGEVLNNTAENEPV
jgi:hypothetical protein